jgi:predicted dehydrogenase
LPVAAPADIGFNFEVSGSEGRLSLSSHHPYGFQAGDLKLAANVAFDKPEEAAVGGGMMGAAINVGEVYAHLARDLMEGSDTTPGFDHALHNARLIEVVARAADRGMRQKLG